MRRRDFIPLIGGVVAWPLAARAQQPEHPRRIGILMNRAADDAEGEARIATFRKALQELGWNEGRNLRLEIRYGEDNIDVERKYAAELVALAPDIILASGTVSMTALQPLSRTMPIVFAVVTDPVGAGFVSSLSQPGGNSTGFMLYEYGFSGKWVELLKQIAPNVTRAGILRDSTNPSGIADVAAIRTVAQSLGMDVSPISTFDAGEIERGIAAFARSANGGLIVTPNSSASLHRTLIIKLAAQYSLPAVYPFTYMATAGGLISYGPDWVDQFRLAASYVDRILKGAKPADLPVQAPTKYQMVINVKTAKALGLTVPSSLLTSADEVVE